MVLQDSKKLIGEVISRARYEKGLTQAELSEKTGISRSYISDVESGRYTPSVRTLTKLATFLEIDLNFLLGMTEKQGINKGGEEHGHKNRNLEWS